MRLPSVRYQQHFPTPQEADHWFIWLQNTTEVRWQQETFSIFGRRVLAPRQLAWIGDAGLNYRYTGLDHKGSGWPESLESLRARIERTAGQKFNFLLLNRYKNGQDYMGWHRDDRQGAKAI